MTKLDLTDEEREQLISWSQDDSVPALAMRAEIVLRSAEPGAVNERIAADLGITGITVGKWRARFAKAGLTGLIDTGRPGRPKVHIGLTDQERAQLAEWSRADGTAAGIGLRARILLACAEGKSNEDVAADLGIHADTVSKWRNRFVRRRLEGLANRQRRGRPTTITPEQVEQVIIATTQESPKNASRWSRATMAQHSGLSKSTIGRIWRTFELNPHLQPADDL
ncbi:helix-turn-helix domain-containing protein [Acrocarpospora corrugata]|uniref:helix-turn-helix domain-containing protein n=1 Tax=Acrocarpospora corrugata TaxID=35763 RepID=UPI0012D2F1DC|nr:helix-turn-helix domain-containing protein [Acrocarpospora corrugata]